MTTASMQAHTLSLYVRNQPGVLVRVALVFSRRGFNIDSLIVSPGAQTEFSRMTITATGDPDGLEQIVKQLAKLVDVVHAIDHTGQDAVETELALIKVRIGITDRTPVLQIAEHFKAKVMDFGADSLVMRMHGTSQKLDNAVELLRGFDIIELVRSGKMLMARGSNIT
jgi:acetolactate synthase I/III small subunit